jgi:hypothetical protein|tara:strand:+ start:1043 stop:1501 length:459 start_codon:yes stop_codon:yes gene_type:complete
MPAFNEALLYGKKVEQLVLDRVRETDPFTLPIPGKFHQFDLYSPMTNTRIEVKSDLKSQETGNFLIEVYMYGKKSALLSTEADIWVFYNGENLIWVLPESIKDLIIENGYQQRVITGKGDTVPKRCYLIPVQEIYSISTKMESAHETNVTPE